MLATWSFKVTRTLDGGLNEADGVPVLVETVLSMLHLVFI